MQNTTQDQQRIYALCNPEEEISFRDLERNVLVSRVAKATVVVEEKD